MLRNAVVHILHSNTSGHNDAPSLTAPRSCHPSPFSPPEGTSESPERNAPETCIPRAFASLSPRPMITGSWCGSGGHVLLPLRTAPAVPEKSPIANSNSAGSPACCSQSTERARQLWILSMHWMLKKHACAGTRSNACICMSVDCARAHRV